MKKVRYSLFLFIMPMVTWAQDPVWSLTDCMKYAVENSPGVKQRIFETDNARAGEMISMGNFLPSLSMSVGNNFGFGRNINPETNTYYNSSSYQNNYSLGTSIPIFQGGQLINQWKQARINLIIAKNNGQLRKDEVAISVMEEYMNVVYYQGAVRMAEEKLEESVRNLFQIRRMYELGLKSLADVAQLEAQEADSELLFVTQQNLYNKALLNLKEYMNYPYEESLQVDTLIDKSLFITPYESSDMVFEYAMKYNPRAIDAENNLKYYELQHKVVKGQFFPTVSLNANISSYYAKILTKNPVTSTETPAETEEELSPEQNKIGTLFGDQLRNNRGEAIYISVSIPLFNRFRNISELRRARNNIKIARENQNEQLRQLQSIIERNVLDKEGYAKEIIKMEKKVEADEIAYRLTVRKFEEGLMSALDVQTSANILIESKAFLLQRKLQYIQINKMIDYYKGIPLVN